MKYQKSVLTLALLVAAFANVNPAAAQSADPTAIRQLQISAFGAASGDFTGLEGGKNLSITAGGDLGLPPWRGMRPTVEVRGTYPIDRGTIDGQKSILGGFMLDFLLSHRLRPYGDFLFGRGEINYQSHNGVNGYIFGNEVYTLTTTYVESPGAGFDYRLNDHLAIKVDGQFQRWASAPTPSGVVYSKVGSAGVVYYFNFGSRRSR